MSMLAWRIHVPNILQGKFSLTLSIVPVHTEVCRTPYWQQKPCPPWQASSLLNHPQQWQAPWQTPHWTRRELAWTHLSVQGPSLAWQRWWCWHGEEWASGWAVGWQGGPRWWCFPWRSEQESLHRAPDSGYCCWRRASWCGRLARWLYHQLVSARKPSQDLKRQSPSNQSQVCPALCPQSQITSWQRYMLQLHNIMLW